MNPLDVVAWGCLGTGALIAVIAGIGLQRFPDFFSRLHAAGTTDTLCAALILLGLGLQAGISLVSLKLFLIFAFLFFTSPTTSHALADAALLGDLKPMLGDGGQEAVK